MTMQIHSTGVKFSGRDRVNSEFSRNFKPGDTVVELVRTLKRQPTEANTYTTTARVVKSIEPHRNAVDSTGAAVPRLETSRDEVDSVTFEDGHKALVGIFSLAQDSGSLYNLAYRDYDGKVYDASVPRAMGSSTDYLVPTKAASFLATVLNELSRRVAKAKAAVQAL